MDTLKEELDLALSLIPVFTMTSCVMCLSPVYEVNGNLKTWDLSSILYLNEGQTS